MSARLMVQQQFRQGKTVYRPGDELTEESLADWTAEQRTNRFEDGFIGYDDPSGEVVNGAVPGAKLRVVETFTAGGRRFLVGEVVDRNETRDWPPASLGNRLESGFMKWVTPAAESHPRVVKAKQAELDAKAAAVLAAAPKPKEPLSKALQAANAARTRKAEERRAALIENRPVAEVVEP